MKDIKRQGQAEKDRETNKKKTKTNRDTDLKKKDIESRWVKDKEKTRTDR